MTSILKGITYSYHRNIGWQDKTIRTLIGLASIIGAAYFLMSSNLPLSAVLGVLAVAQLGTAFSSRCIICYFSGLCTISKREMKSLESKGILYEKYNL